jgi:hypothetical protein
VTSEPAEPAHPAAPTTPLARAAKALAHAKALEAAAQTEVDHIAAACDEAQERLLAVKAQIDRAADAQVEALLGNGSKLVEDVIPEVGPAQLAHDRLLARHTTATETLARLRISRGDAELEHRRAAAQCLADEANYIAREILRHEERSAELWREIDVLSRLWLAGANAGPVRFGREVILTLQHPPRLVSVDVAPPAARAQTERIAAGWRDRFERLLAEPPK